MIYCCLNASADQETAQETRISAVLYLVPPISTVLASGLRTLESEGNLCVIFQMTLSQGRIANGHEVPISVANVEKKSLENDSRDSYCLWLIIISAANHATDHHTAAKTHASAG
jgi:hypothetical protein